METEEDLHRETVSTAIAHKVAHDPRIYIFPARDPELRVISPVVQPIVANLALYGTRLDDVFVRTVIFIDVGVGFPIILVLDLVLVILK